MKFLIGIEGIGTRYSVAVLSDSDGKILSAERLYLPLSLHTTPRPLLRLRLRRLIRAVLHPVQLTLDDLQKATICIGLSGITFEHNAKVDLTELFEELRVFPERLICTADTDIIFASHAFSDSGSTITCSMGSMASVTTPAQPFRAGGWGPVLGDEGSGYWMGRAALRAIGNEVETRQQPESILWTEIRRFLDDPQNPINEWKEHSIHWRLECSKYTHGEDIRTAIFLFSHYLSLESTMDWRSIASSLVIPLMRAWLKGDPAAKRIVRKAASYLIRQHQQACRLAEVEPNYGPLVLYGGVFTHNKEFLNLVEERIKNVYNCDMRIIAPASFGTLRPACGALLLALGGSETAKLRLPSPPFIYNFVKQEELHKSKALVND